MEKHSERTKYRCIRQPSHCRHQQTINLTRYDFFHSKYIYSLPFLHPIVVVIMVCLLPKRHIYILSHFSIVLLLNVFFSFSSDYAFRFVFVYNEIGFKI